MSSLRSLVSSFLRLLAVGLLLLGLAMLAVGWLAQHQGKGGAGTLLSGAAAFVVGILLLVFSSAIARRITRDYE